MTKVLTTKQIKENAEKARRMMPELRRALVRTGKEIAELEALRARQQANLERYMADLDLYDSTKDA